MRNLFRASLAVIAVLTAVSTVEGHAAPLIGPQASAAEIRAAHGDPGPAYRIAYEKTIDGVSSPMEVTLAPGYVAIKSEDQQTVLDFKLRRAIDIVPEKRSFANWSLFWHVSFRVHEAMNRTHMRKTLRAMNSDLARQIDPYYVGAELGVPLPDEPNPAIEKTRGPDGTLGFVYDGVEVVSVTPSTVRLPGSLRQRFVQYMRYRLQVHPDIADALAELEFVPQTISYVYMPNSALPESRHVTLELKSTGDAKADYPLPADYKPEPLTLTHSDELTPVRDLLPVMLQATAGTYGSGPRTTASYKSAIDAAMREKKILQALTLALELSLQRGDQLETCDPADSSCHTFPEIIEAARKDERATALMTSLQLDATDPAAATAMREGIDRKDISNAYLIDAFLANGLIAQDKRKEEALRLLQGAIRGNPYASNFYQDIGDYYVRSFDHKIAWLFYDFGRSLPERNQAGNNVLAGVDRMEASLALSFPGFF